MGSRRAALLGDGGWVSDGGLETDLIFHKGIGLPDFASFPLVDDEGGRVLLERYYDDYAAIAVAAGAGLVLETPTWRANPDWGARLGYGRRALGEVNRRAVDLVRSVASRSGVEQVLLSGVVGPRGDGYVASDADADRAAEYHAEQIGSLAAAGVDLVHAMTMAGTAEAVGVATAAAAAGVPVAISFTVETDGRLPDGTPLADAVVAVDAVAPPDWYGVNCAHPTHVVPASAEGPRAGAADWRDRVVSLRPNASTLTHQELDEMAELDPGDLDLLVRSTAALRGLLPAVQVVGGCCGTDASHVAALWGVPHPDGAAAARTPAR